MAADVTAGLGPRGDSWTPARIFMAMSAIFHVPVALIGLAIDQSFPVGADATARAGSEHILGILET
ncbi:MAG: hypothetical protein M3271_07935, partial [Actinomycetota bacterium]|nr:hypothetical protein [Actinomycetota bacterium]